MSFEGFYQLICANGHYWCTDVHSGDKTSTCPTCNERPIWYNLVDQTNGMCSNLCLSNECENCDKRMDGYIKMEMTSQEVCGHCNSILDRKYKIPEYGGHQLKEMT